MTEIRDQAPIVFGEPRPEPAATGLRTGAVLWAAAALLACVNVVAAGLVYRAGSDLRSVEARLERLDAFEERIRRGLDTMNTGVHSQFDRQNGDLQQRFTEMHGRLQRMETEMTALRDKAAEARSAVSGVETRLSVQDFFAPPVFAEEPDAEALAAIEPAPTRKPTAKPRPTPSVAYQRVESADGKVYYRKMR